jgi:AcrR family transcriptional regulator
MNTRDKIIRNATQIMALHGANGVSMRKLATECAIAPSVLYHYFENKDYLLKDLFYEVSKNLGRERRKLTDADDPIVMLRQRIEFQIDHAEEIVAVLKYYMAYRETFPKQEQGYVPDTAYLHIKEVLDRGIADGVFIPMDVDEEAKVIAHAINGFLLEYYPDKPEGDEREALINSIHRFVVRSIAKDK